MNSGSQQLRIGVIGLGTMGFPMAERLMAAHGAIQIYARARDKVESLIRAGAQWNDTPAQLAARCDAVLLILPDLPQLYEVLDGPEGILAGADDLLLMIASTSSPTGVRDLAVRVAEQTAGKVRVVDCPVSGGEDGSRAGTLSIMLGGDDPDARLAQAALAPCGTVVHLGPLGAGQVAKACNQLVVAATIMALGEASVLASRSGIDVGELWELLGGGYAGSNLLASRQQKLAAEDYTPSGIASFMIKDLNFANDVAEATDTHAVLLPQLRKAFDELVRNGFGNNDISVARKYIETRDQFTAE